MKVGPKKLGDEISALIEDRSSLLLVWKAYMSSRGEMKMSLRLMILMGVSDCILFAGRCPVHFHGEGVLGA